MNWMRKVRSDAIVHGLPAAQRAKVDGWLFDKGLTYQAVAQACGNVFGVKVSKSSVARYHERRMREELRRKRNATVARQTEGLNEEERYEALLAKLSDLAMETAEELKAEALNTRQGWRRIVQITRVLIAARRERNQRMRAELERMKFEMRSAKACLKYVRVNRHGAKAERLAAQEHIARQLDKEWKAWKARGNNGLAMARGVSIDFPGSPKRNPKTN